MKINTEYVTVSEALADLSKKGYTSHFSFHEENDYLICKQTTRKLWSEDFEVDSAFRFSGETDTNVEVIIFAIYSNRYDIKGVVVNTFSVYSEPPNSKIVEKLTRYKTVQ